MSARPQVLIFAATDGTAGAGVIADCRTVVAAGCLPFAVVTAITAQNLSSVESCWHLPPVQLRQQFALLPQRPAAVKIGVVGSVAAATIAVCLDSLPGVPIVWDPVIAPSAGKAFNNAAQTALLRRRLLPRTFVLTPNRRELLALAGTSRVAAAVAALSKDSAAHLLVTDIDGRGAQVRHVLFVGGKPHWEATATRQRGVYHGSGCLFSSTLAARLAKGDKIQKAAAAAHQATLQAIARANERSEKNEKGKTSATAKAAKAQLLF